MNWTALTIVGVFLALITFVWYTIKRSVTVDQVEEDAKQQAQRIKEMQEKALETEKALREKEKTDGKIIVDSGNTGAAGELLRDAFKSDNK